VKAPGQAPTHWRMQMRRLALVSAGVLLPAACATSSPVPLPKNHPASAAAQEAPVTPLRYGLEKDAATQRTEALLNPGKEPGKGSP